LNGRERPWPGILTEAEMRDFQKNNILAALTQAGGRISGPGGAAELLDVKPTTLADRIRAYGVHKPDKR
jgi:transcriptional regulator with GAF, ATPase, and Fis domain